MVLHAISYGTVLIFPKHSVPILHVFVHYSPSSLTSHPDHRSFVPTYLLSLQEILWGLSLYPHVRAHPEQSKHGFCCHSSLQRRDNLQAFKDGEARFLICTDVAARGIDIRGLPYVINMTLPASEEKESYVHRIGRVGRANHMGLAIAIVSTVREKVSYHSLTSLFSDFTHL